MKEAQCEHITGNFSLQLSYIHNPNYGKSLAQILCDRTGERRIVLSQAAACTAVEIACYNWRVYALLTGRVDDGEGRVMQSGPNQLVNDTVLNVAQLLKENVGSKRFYDVTVAELPLDDDVVARNVQANIKLTRIADGILVTGTVAGQARLECVRCLEEFDTDYSGEIEAEFRPSIDIQSGYPVEVEEDDDSFDIDDSHQLDLTELLRQVTILSLPIRPVCGDDCPGFTSEFRGGDEAPGEDAVDERLSVLEQLLDDSREQR